MFPFTTVSWKEIYYDSWATIKGYQYLFPQRSNQAFGTPAIIHSAGSLIHAEFHLRLRWPMQVDHLETSSTFEWSSFITTTRIKLPGIVQMTASNVCIIWNFNLWNILLYRLSLQSNTINLRFFNANKEWSWYGKISYLIIKLFNWL